MRYNPDVLFRSTAPYYARYRSGYPPELFQHLGTRFSLDGTQQALDLGCGTGQIALPLAAYVGRVLAIDPESGMLTEGQRLAEDRDIDNIDWIVGDSYRLSELDLPDLTLVTIGAAFHWMDRSTVLQDLDRLVLPTGAVVITSGGMLETQTPPPWNDIITAIRTKYLGPARRAGSTTYSHPAEGHTDVLRRSPFSHVQTVEWNWTLERDLDSLIGLQFSYSFSAPAQFDSGEQRAAFERDLRDALTEQFPSRTFPESVHTEALIATRL
ncbi:class I SAM-dependent methyltransferase [Nocardia sp. CA2R105]|uniref:class I SAM-dependent methyltransferase n=1 Tax=Nocardia coffeae TaxID=2873381 RepID=UPI001CA68BD0|nr:class I SAM-dependent methyltransferase [Nocardia coffeae]MBY8863471.1 class I SAM-dependent methyltransferase [Nocardia coffeae]